MSEGLVGFMKAYFERELSAPACTPGGSVRRAFCLVFWAILGLALLFEVSTFWMGPHLCVGMGLLGVATHVLLSQLEHTDPSRQVR